MGLLDSINSIEGGVCISLLGVIVSIVLGCRANKRATEANELAAAANRISEEGCQLSRDANSIALASAGIPLTIVEFLDVSFSNNFCTEPTIKAAMADGVVRVAVKVNNIGAKDIYNVHVGECNEDIDIEEGPSDVWVKKIAPNTDDSFYFYIELSKLSDRQISRRYSDLPSSVVYAIDKSLYWEVNQGRLKRDFTYYLRLQVREEDDANYDKFFEETGIEPPDAPTVFSTCFKVEQEDAVVLKPTQIIAEKSNLINV